MARKTSRRQRARHRGSRPSASPDLGAARAGPSQDAPRQRGRLFWICALVLVEALVWSALSAVTDSGTARMLASLGLGVVLVIVLRHRIWGPDWRAQLAASRARRPR